MTTKGQHPFLAFADRYADPTQNYLNAYVALSRAEALVDDLERVSTMLDREGSEQRWSPWFGAEIISYYAVGFVTCLEWHARSRLVDLLTSMPKALRPEDMKGVSNDKLIVQMIAEQAPITHLIAASKRVTSAEQYFSLFKRIFEDLGIPTNIGDWITGSDTAATVCWLRSDQIQSVHDLFDFRHDLVHEIGAGTMGHFNIRESWSPLEAVHYGRISLSLISAIESALTHFAPKSFPNLLTEERWPISSTDQLSAQYSELRATAQENIRNAEWEDPRTPESWRKLETLADQYFDAEESFIAHAEMLHWRYFDARAPLRLMSLRYRIAFLEEILKNCQFGGGEDPQA